jgi:hypothetical protein
MTTLKEVNFETISLKDLEKIVEKEPLLELRERVMMVDKAVRKMEMPALSTPTERIKLRENMLSKANLMRQIIAIKEGEQKRIHDKQELEFSEKSAKTHVHDKKDLRYCSEPAIVRMASEGTTIVPHDVVQWLTPTSTELEFLCQSGKKRKLDLTKIPASLWRTLEEKSMRPIFLTVESSGMIDKKGNRLGLWSDQENYESVMSQKQISATVVALMVV